MTKPKRWFIVSENDKLFVKRTDGTYVAKPNATQPLGQIKEVTIPDPKYLRPDQSVSDVLEFQCENGRIVLKVKNQAGLGLSVEFLGVETSHHFIQKWKETFPDLETGTATSLDSETGLPSPAVQLSSQPSSQTTPGIRPKRPSPILLNEQASPSKKRRYIVESFDEEIENKKKGLMELPVAQIQPPTQSRLLRDADPRFMKSLRERMVLDPSAPGASPMIVLCLDVQSPAEFNPKYKDVYKYEALGGMHSLLCKSQLGIEYPENPFYKTAVADVYVGLSDEQALRLAKRHNEVTHFVHKVTHRDMVEACRNRLFALSDATMDRETPHPTAAWKKSCAMAILPKDISSTHKDNIFHQASLSKRVWNIAVEVMDAFENSKLKGQKLNLDKLVQKPEFRQNYFAPIRSLEEDDQCLLLQRVLKKEIKLLSLHKEAALLKQRKEVKKVFLKLTNIDSWEQAKIQCPHFTTDSQLQRYDSFDFKKSIPASFSDLCNRAKIASSSDHPENSSITRDGYTVHLLVSKPTAISGVMLRNLFPAFQGASLSIMHIGDEETIESVRSLAYTIKEVNAYVNCKSFVLAALTTDTMFPSIISEWEKVLTVVQPLFFADTDKKGNDQTYLTSCVSVMVMGFFTVSESETPSKDLLNFSAKDPRHNFIMGSHSHLYSTILQNFSHSGSTILDLTGCGGFLPKLALEAGRQIITLSDSESAKSSILSELEECHLTPHIDSDQVLTPNEQ